MAGDKFRNCTRQCQNGFIPVRDFTMDQMPEGYQNDRRWKDFEMLCARTVKLKVSYTSHHRPETHPDSTALYPYCRYRGREGVNRTGTGYIMFFNDKQPWVKNERCPCPECTKGQGSAQAKNGYFKVFVMTAASVVFDDGEAEKTVCEVFDDDPDNRDKVRYLYGIKGMDRESLDGLEGLGAFVRDTYDRLDMGNIENRPRHDMFFMECVSHDWMFYKELESVLGGWDDMLTDIPVIVSHPHGASKMVSVGRTPPALGIQLPMTHTPDTPFNIPVNTDVETGIDLETPSDTGFFEKDPIIDTRYKTTQPLHLYIPCDDSNTATFRCKEGPDSHYLLPEGSRLTSVDGETDIPYNGIGFDAHSLLGIFDLRDRSHHYVYDIHTCKGSAGARVPTKGGLGLDPLRCHFGKVVGGLNRTGMYKY